MQKSMKGARLPGNSTVEMKEFRVPDPGHGEVLVKMKSSTICGSDIRAIYREHLGKGPEGYQNVIAGHEPCGQVVATGAGMRRFKTGDRVIVYHISGCGVCNDCRRGYMISCSSPLRAAYGWQRDGGMAEYLLAEEKDLVLLPDNLSYTDGAQVACGFGTVYEALSKIGISGTDRVLITGLGPVGLATAMLARALGAGKIIGTDISESRAALARKLGLVDAALVGPAASVEAVLKLTGGKGVERSIDCSGNDAARQLAVRSTREWGKVALVGEGGTFGFAPSPDLIHGQKTIYGSWVTSIWRMEELVEKLSEWDLHPDRLVTHRFSLDRCAEAYTLMAGGECGKVAVCFDEELTNAGDSKVIV
ncbi:MAG TPA: zinc-binding dehydrogenase [Spirochaetia bacterium]|nr:zinc-binding dehydrogenase [Spirochaetia bacterium]